MFGIIMAIVSTGTALIDGIRRGHENVQAIKRGYQRQLDGTDDTNTYFDIHGNRRDLKTHQIRKVDFAIVESHGQDRCIRDQYGNIVRNYTEEKREARRKEALANNRTVYLYRELANGIYSGEEHREFGGDGYCEGQQYKDLSNGHIYVGRSIMIKGTQIEHVDFYMDLNGYLVREADSWRLKRKRNETLLSKDEVNRFIIEFNNNQRNNKPKPHLDNFGKPIKNNGEYIYDLGQYYHNKNNCPMEV